MHALLAKDVHARVQDDKVLVTHHLGEADLARCVIFIDFDHFRVDQFVHEIAQGYFGREQLSWILLLDPRLTQVGEDFLKQVGLAVVEPVEENRRADQILPFLSFHILVNHLPLKLVVEVAFEL